MANGVQKIYHNNYYLTKDNTLCKWKDNFQNDTEFKKTLIIKQVASNVEFVDEKRFMLINFDGSICTLNYFWWEEIWGKACQLPFVINEQDSVYP